MIYQIYIYGVHINYASYNDLIYLKKNKFANVGGATD